MKNPEEGKGIQCEENSETESSEQGTGIAQIKLKRVAREVSPEERAEIERQREAYYAGKTIDDISSEGNTLEGVNGKQVLGLALLLIFCAIVWFAAFFVF